MKTITQITKKEFHEAIADFLRKKNIVKESQSINVNKTEITTDSNSNLVYNLDYDIIERKNV